MQEEEKRQLETEKAEEKAMNEVSTEFTLLAQLIGASTTDGENK